MKDLERVVEELYTLHEQFRSLQGEFTKKEELIQDFTSLLDNKQNKNENRVVKNQEHLKANVKNVVGNERKGKKN